jgi:uncharacterized membrane protein YgcG
MCCFAEFAGVMLLASIKQNLPAPCYTPCCLVLQYYFSPAGKRYRSRMEVGVAMGRAHAARGALLHAMLRCEALPGEQSWGCKLPACLPCPQIARDFGLADDKPPKASSGGGAGGSGRSRKSEGGGGGGGGTPSVPLTREAALAAAQKRLAAFQLPHTLECGVTVTNLGALRPNDAGLRSLVGWC